MMGAKDLPTALIYPLATSLLQQRLRERWDTGQPPPCSLDSRALGGERTILKFLFKEK